MIKPGTYTVKEFAEASGLTEEHIRKCCRGAMDRGRTMELPHGWQARKTGRDWKIFSSGPFTHFDSLANISLEDMCRTVAMAEDNFNYPKSFAFFRMAYLTQAMKAYIKDGEPTPFAIAEMIWNLTKDSELADLLAERWQLRVKVEGAADYPKQYRRLTASKEMLPAIKDDDAAFEQGLFATRPKLQDAPKLFDSIREAFTKATGSKTECSVTVRFQPDGSWKLGPLPPASDDLERYRQQDKPIKDLLPGSLEELFYLTWLRKIDERSPGFQGERWEQCTGVLSHPMRDEFFRRCWYCGQRLESSRSNRRTCKNNTCKPNLSKWIKALSEEKNLEARKRKIADRLKRISMIFNE